MGLVWVGGYLLVFELSEPNKSTKRSGPEDCWDEPILEPTPELEPIPKGSKKSPIAATESHGEICI